jgi:23S rRNA (cytidine1920-2'-O)/16S rRNA (cytidine1409-2'-O)-methyltransferase
MSTPSRPARMRADVRLVELGLAPSRQMAQAMILAGEVFAGERRVDKPGAPVASDAALRVAPRRRFVSRGGDKLDGALEDFGERFRDLSGRVALDIGASTGGFTDCLLQRGAARVFAVDVGHGQLDQKLRTDPRVDVREGTNARELAAADFDAPIDLVVVDASFIGLGLLMPAIARVLDPAGGGELIALVKPQFEAGRAEVSRGKGVIRDPDVRDEAIASARGAIVASGFAVIAEADCRLKGPKGNVERFVLARRVGAAETADGPSER